VPPAYLESSRFRPLARSRGAPCRCPGRLKLRAESTSAMPAASLPPPLGAAGLLRRRLDLAAPQRARLAGRSRREPAGSVSHLPAEAREGLMRARLEILREKRPVAAWVPAGQASSQPALAETSFPPVAVVAAADELAASAYDHHSITGARRVPTPTAAGQGTFGPFFYSGETGACQRSRVAVIS